MFGKIKQGAEMLKAQKKVNDLKKKLDAIKVEIEEGNVKVVLKGSIAMYEVDYIEIDGEKVELFSRAMKRANKEMAKELQKRVKNGQISMSELGMM